MKNQGFNTRSPPRALIVWVYLQRKGGGRNTNKELEGEAAGKPGERVAERGKYGGVAEEDQPGSIRFDTESGQKLPTAKRGTLKKSMASPRFPSVTVKSNSSTEGF